MNFKLAFRRTLPGGALKRDNVNQSQWCVSKAVVRMNSSLKHSLLMFIMRFNNGRNILHVLNACKKLEHSLITVFVISCAEWEELESKFLSAQ